MGERSWAPGALVLASAARAVLQVAARGRSADDALAPFDSHPDRAAIRAVTLSSLRWYLRLVAAVTSLVARRAGSLAPELRALLVVAAHQIEYSRNRPEASVDAGVDAARVLGQPRATGLANAVLRRFIRERAELFARLDADLATATAHPAWLVREVEHAWPGLARSVLDGNNAHPPLVLRVDLSRGTTDAYLAELSEAGCPGHAIGWAPAAVELAEARAVDAIPGFRAGRVSVQDAGAQLAAPLLGAQAGMRVLDACAAPGGKTLHLLERTAGLAELVAIDVDAARLARIAENLARSRRQARLIALDARALSASSVAPGGPLAGAPFDRVLVDAPCSSTGVIRRHPDIKLLRRASDVAAFVELQRAILAGAFQVLAPGGRLLYCTCSVLPAENEQLVAWFLGSERRARELSLPAAGQLAPGARSCAIGVQLLPGAEAGTDGFYFACLEKTTAGH